MLFLNRIPYSLLFGRYQYVEPAYWYRLNAEKVVKNSMQRLRAASLGICLLCGCPNRVVVEPMNDQAFVSPPRKQPDLAPATPDLTGVPWAKQPHPIKVSPGEPDPGTFEPAYDTENNQE